MNATDTTDIEHIVGHYGALILTVLSAIALVVNIYILNCSRFLRRPIGVNLRLCVTLTAADALCAFFYITSFTINFFVPEKYRPSTCWSLLVEALKLATFFASVFTLLSLALNHYVGIVYPLRRHIITSKTVKMAIILSFLVPLAATLTIFSVHPSGFRSGRAFGFFVQDGCATARVLQDVFVRWIFVVPFILIVLLLSFLYLHIIFHMSTMAKDPLLTANNNNNRSKRSTNRKLLVTLMMLAGSACVGWLPTTVMYVLLCTDCVFPQARSFYMMLSIIAQSLNVLKLIFDAFIYASRLIEIRYSIWAFNVAVRSNLTVWNHRHSDATVPSEFSKYVTDTKDNKKDRQHLAALDAPSVTCPVKGRTTSMFMAPTNHPFKNSQNTRSMKIFKSDRMPKPQKL
ncbi:unnamed protein product, partial [Mesorhabditis spiculigera]